MLKKHNEFCGCNYCNILKEYVQLKKYSTRFYRTYENIEYFDEKIEREYMNNYKTLECTIRTMKLHKDSLKKI